MQHVGQNFRTFIVNNGWVSILVLLDAARRPHVIDTAHVPAGCFDPCSPGCSPSACSGRQESSSELRVSILVLLDAARRQQMRSDDLEIHYMFRSLFSWMQHVGGMDCALSVSITTRFRSLFSWMQHVGATRHTGPTARNQFRSLFSWMQHVGPLRRARALSTGLVSILVLLDAARRRPFCRGVLTCILVSILVLLDAARRQCRS